MRKAVSLLLSALLTLGCMAVAVTAGGDAPRVTGDTETITFGSYPKTDVTEEMGETLSEEFPFSEEEWSSYGYYSANEPADYMWYKDVTFGGEKYRGVEIGSNRPSWLPDAINSDSLDGSKQTVNGYFAGSTYWFRFDPLELRVLDSPGYVICEDIIDSGNFAPSSNSYTASDIRKWLNEDFINTAFDDNQKQAIIPYTQDGLSDSAFLLSMDEMKNTGWFADSSALCAAGTDYARCQGLLVINIPDNEFSGNSSWWLRSNYAGESSFACAVSFMGGDIESNVRYTHTGIRPALLLDLEKVNAREITEEMVGDITAQTCTGSEITPDLVIRDGDYILTEGEDYEVSFSDNVSEGTATAVITGINNYSGTVTVTFAINPAPAPAKEGRIAGFPTKAVLIRGTAVDFGADTGYGRVIYSSDNPGVAEVDENGTVTANGKGECVITAQVEGSDIINECSVKVTTSLLQFVLAIFSGIREFFLKICVKLFASAL